MLKVIPSSSQELGFLGGSTVKNLPCYRKDAGDAAGSILLGETPEEGLATQPSVLALRIP